MNGIEQYKQRFYNLMESTMGDVKPLINEQDITSNINPQVKGILKNKPDSMYDFIQTCRKQGEAGFCPKIIDNSSAEGFADSYMKNPKGMLKCIAALYSIGSDNNVYTYDDPDTIVKSNDITNEILRRYGTNWRVDNVKGEGVKIIDL